VPVFRLPVPSARFEDGRRRLREALFPEAVYSEGQPPRWERAGLLAAFLALGTVLALLRLGFSASVNTLWAEDGPIYLQGALTQGFFHDVFSPYAGYLVVVPRLVAEAATLVPLDQAAAAITIVSAFLAAVSAFAVWVGCGGHVRNPYLRLGLAAATLLSVTAGQETVLSAAYLPWYMLCGAFWLLFWRARTLGGALLGGLFLLATGLSTPGVWFFMPVALLRAATAKDARDGALLGPYFLGALVQIPVMLAQQQGDSLWTSHIWTAFLQRVLLGGLLGEEISGSLWADLGWTLLIVSLVLFAVGFAWRLWRGPSPARWFGVLGVLTSVVMFVFSTYSREVGEYIYLRAGIDGAPSGRYVMVPALIFLSVVVVFVDSAVRDWGSSLKAYLAAAATVALIALAIATSYNLSEPSMRGRPYWDEALRDAATKCVSEREGTAGIPISPEPWGVQVPCEQVASYAEAGPGS
jgi:hypothetical protein